MPVNDSTIARIAGNLLGNYLYGGGDDDAWSDNQVQAVREAVWLARLIVAEIDVSTAASDTVAARAVMDAAFADTRRALDEAAAAARKS
jgi:hypothetical protein